MTKMTRVSKYEDLRKNIKGEVGIDRKVIEEPKITDDDFLSFIPNKNVNNELSETGKFEKALYDVTPEKKVDHSFDTRLNILNKIRTPQSPELKIESVEKTNQKPRKDSDYTSVFKTYKELADTFKKPKKEETFEKSSVTLFERLSELSPKEDVQVANQYLKDHNIQIQQEEIKQTESFIVVAKRLLKNQRFIEQSLKVAISFLLVVFVILTGIILFQLM